MLFYLVYAEIHAQHTIKCEQQQLKRKTCGISHAHVRFLCIFRFCLKPFISLTVYVFLYFLQVFQFFLSLKMLFFSFLFLESSCILYYLFEPLLVGTAIYFSFYYYCFLFNGYMHCKIVKKKVQKEISNSGAKYTTEKMVGETDEKGAENPLRMFHFFSQCVLRSKRKRDTQINIEFYGVLCFHFGHFICSVNNPFFQAIRPRQKKKVSHRDDNNCVLGRLCVIFIQQFSIQRIRTFNRTNKIIHSNAFPKSWTIWRKFVSWNSSRSPILLVMCIYLFYCPEPFFPWPVANRSHLFNTLNLLFFYIASLGAF